MTVWLVAIFLLAACRNPDLVYAGEPLVVVQETRTPAGTKQRPSMQHVAVLKNVSPAPVHGIRVTVEFCDFFGKVIWVRSAVPSPASLEPGETATLSLSTPRLESMRRTRYRFEFGRSAPHPARHGARGDAVPSGSPRPTAPRSLSR